jgi:hypothetical protein
MSIEVDHRPVDLEPSRYLVREDSPDGAMNMKPANNQVCSCVARSIPLLLFCFLQSCPQLRTGLTLLTILQSAGEVNTTDGAGIEDFTPLMTSKMGNIGHGHVVVRLPSREVNTTTIIPLPTC